MDRTLFSNFYFLITFLHIGSVTGITTEPSLLDIEDIFYAPTPINGLAQDKISGNVYIGGRNYIYALSENLQLLTNSTTLDDSCSDKNTPRCNSKNSVLLIDNDNGLITACSDFHPGLCDRYSLKGIGDVLGTATITPTLKNRAFPIVAFSAPISPEVNDGIHVVIKMNVTDLGTATSTKCFVKHELVEFDGDVSGPTNTPVYACKEDVKPKYGYGYQHNGYQTMIFVVARSVDTDGNPSYETRATITHKPAPDKALYKQVALGCQHGSVHYDNLITGLIAIPGDDLIKTLTIANHKNLVFFGLFAKTGEQTSSSDDKSALCMYPLEDLNVIRNDDNLAQYDNPYNDGWYIIRFLKKVEANAVTVFSHPVTAISIATVEDNTVAFVGTDTGHVLKVFVASDSEATQYEDVTVKDASPVNSNMILGSDGSSLYVPVDSSVARIQVDVCSTLDEYNSCLRSNDPYCGWCYNELKCSRKSECNVAWTWAVEEPIELVSASPIHIKQEKKLTLKIKNMPKYLSQFECGFQSQNTIARSTATIVSGPDRDDVSTVECETSAADPRQEVHEERLYLYIGQTGISLEKTLYFGMVNCSQYLTCTHCTNHTQGCKWCSQDHKCVADEEYCLYSDDVITSHDLCPSKDSETVMPYINVQLLHKKGILGGGNILEINGYNLNQTHDPKMLLYFDNRKYESDCDVQSKVKMACPLPRVNHSSVQSIKSNNYPLIKLPYGFSFTFDNFTIVQNSSGRKVDLYPNPELDKLSQTREPDDKDLSLTGNHLDLALEGDDYMIYIGKVKCPVTALSRGKIYCELQDNVHEQSDFQVTVRAGNLNWNLGSIQWSYNDAAGFPMWAGIVIVVIVVIVIVAATVVFLKYRAKKRKERRSRMKTPPMPEAPPMLTPRTLWERLDPSLQESLENHVIDCTRMKLMDEIGSGYFGKVYIGELDKGEKTMEVAIKTINIATEDIREINEFMKESTIMVDFNHPNVMHLLGVVIKDEKPYIILPFMDKGDLNHHISDDSIQFTVIDLLRFIHQVAKGMAYLSKKKFVHRDLAARNCMVNSSKQVKIADFGLSRDIYEKDYYRLQEAKPMPIRWMSLESLEHSIYTTKSDVWSYGILMWEVMTRGIKPYSHIGNTDIICYLQVGKRLEKPPHAPEIIYEMMLKCWLENPDDRPSFEGLEHELNTLLINNASDNRENVSAEESEDYLLPIRNDEYVSVVRRDTKREVR